MVAHFAADGLTRSDYFKAVAAEPLLLRQKPAQIIRNIEAVMDHYAAERPMRTEYLQAAVEQPVLFRTPPTMVFASIEAAVDHLDVTLSDRRSQAAPQPPVSHQEPINAHPATAISPASPTAEQGMPSAIPTGQTADSSQVPTTSVRNPVLYVSYAAPAQRRGR